MKAVPKTKAKPVKRRVARTTKPRAARKNGAARSGTKSYGERRLPRILRVLRAALPDLKARYRVKSLGVFGSYVRNDATKKSDVDVLIEFEEDARLGLFEFVHIQNELTDLLGIQVDLISKGGLKPRISENVMKEVVMV